MVARLILRLQHDHAGMGRKFGGQAGAGHTGTDDRNVVTLGQNHLIRVDRLRSFRGHGPVEKFGDRGHDSAAHQIHFAQHLVMGFLAH